MIALKFILRGIIRGFCFLLGRPFSERPNLIIPSMWWFMHNRVIADSPTVTNLPRRNLDYQPHSLALPASFAMEDTSTYLPS